MLDTEKPTAATIRQKRAENPKMRDRDFADSLGISEADLVAAHVGNGVTVIDAHPDNLIPQAEKLGEVMALTRNPSCVIERIGTYTNYHTGRHAAMVLDAEIDLRIFPKFWEHAFAVEKQTDAGVRRSLQIFNGVGDAVHKIHLRDTSNHDAWDGIVATLRLDTQNDTLDLRKKSAPEAPKADPAKVDQLRAEWDQMTDTHQFQKVLSKLKMNRLGAYQIAGDPYVRRLASGTVEQAFEKIAKTGMGVMIFVGNRGCIQIHGGTCENLKTMGPWFNVLDPRFDMHLRVDHIDQIYAVRKFANGGEALSLEAFDAQGRLILQIFPYQRASEENAVVWKDILSALPSERTE